MRSRNLTIGLVSSVVVVAAAIGLLLLLGPARADGLELPEKVDGLVANDVAAAYPGRPASDPSLRTALDRARTGNETNSDGWSEVFDDAAADTRVYTSTRGDDTDVVTAVAVRADAGPLLPASGFVDPRLLGLALPQQERVTRDGGEVECVLFRSSPPRAGQRYQPDQAAPDSQVCQRRSGVLTVRVTWATGDTDRVVDVVQDLWDDVD